MKPKMDPVVIYEAALVVFARYGYEKSSLEDIAKVLKMTKGSLYTYVKNKRDLYQKTVAYALRRWQSKVAESVRNESEPRAQLELLCDRAIGYLREEKRFRELLRNDPDIFPMFNADDPYREINDRSRDMIGQILTAGIETKAFNPVDVPKTAEILFSIYKMFIIQAYVKTDEEFISRMLKDTLSLITEGLYRREGAPG